MRASFVGGGGGPAGGAALVPGVIAGGGRTGWRWVGRGSPPRAGAGALSSPGGWGRRLLHRRQRPAVASELTRHGDGHDRAPLATALERVPALVQTARTGIGTRSYRCRLPLPPPLERGARAYGPALVPGGLDEQASRVRIARLRDRALAASLAGGVLARDEAEEGSEALWPEAVPVAELDGEPERGKGGAPTEADA